MHSLWKSCVNLNQTNMWMTYQNLRYAAQKNTELQTLKQNMCLNSLPYIPTHTLYEGRSGSGMPRVGVCDVWHCSSNCNPSVCIDKQHGTGGLPENPFIRRHTDINLSATVCFHTWVTRAEVWSRSPSPAILSSHSTASPPAPHSRSAPPPAARAPSPSRTQV